jgi:hypothetical protein
MKLIFQYAALAAVLGLFAFTAKPHEIETGRGVLCARQDQIEKSIAQAFGLSARRSRSSRSGPQDMT